jgi:hypothetical protein
MSGRSTRRAVTLLAAAGALLTVAFAAVPQADAATLYACVKKEGGAMRLVGEKTKCHRRSERKVSWSITGPAGKNGATCKNGANGANGTNGKEGPAGPLTDALPSGKSEKGAWVYALSGKTGLAGVALSFPIPLAAAPTAHFIEAGATPPAGCSGSVAAPAASPGNLCVFSTFPLIGLTLRSFFDPENFTETSTASGKTGAIVLFNATEGSQQAAGTYAVSA